MLLRIGEWCRGAPGIGRSVARVRRASELRGLLRPLRHLLRTRLRDLIDEEQVLRDERLLEGVVVGLLLLLRWLRLLHLLQLLQLLQLLIEQTRVSALRCAVVVVVSAAASVGVAARACSVGGTRMTRHGVRGRLFVLPDGLVHAQQCLKWIVAVHVDCSVVLWPSATALLERCIGCRVGLRGVLRGEHETVERVVELVQLILATVVVGQLGARSVERCGAVERRVAHRMGCEQLRHE